MENNNYQDIAERYDWMLSENPHRTAFFRWNMSDHDVNKSERLIIVAKKSYATNFH